MGENVTSGTLSNVDRNRSVERNFKPCLEVAYQLLSKLFEKNLVCWKVSAFLKGFSFLLKTNFN